MMHNAVTLGDKIELTKKTEITEADTYYSMIYEILDDRKIMIQAPLEAGRIVPLEKEVIYYACIYTDRGLYRGEVELTKRLKDGKLHYLELTLITPIKKYQRRQYYRMNCVLSFQFFLEGQDDVLDEEHKYQGTLLDISGGGIRFSTDQQISINTRIKCHLRLKLTDYSIDLEAAGLVLQSKAIEPDQTYYQNRVMFDELGQEDREKIIKFIFEEERKRRKKEKGL